MIVIRKILLVSLAIGINGHIGQASHFTWYPKSYEEARIELKKQIAILKEKEINVVHTPLKVPSPQDNNLFIDAVLISHKKTTPNKLVILSSGIHGAEAFTGSALQVHFLNHYFQVSQLQSTSFLIIHGMNPYGFRYRRRVTENNVDLNRNFFDRLQKKPEENKIYPSLNEFLNKNQPVERSFLKGLSFFASTVKKFLSLGKSDLRQGTLQGQYSFPKGLFFGGTKEEPQVSLYKELLDSLISPYEYILHIDLHTGYGQKGVLHLFSTNSLPSQNTKFFEKTFSNLKIDRGSQKNFYNVHGDFTQFTVDLYPNKKVIPMTFEFGTQNSQSLRGSFYSLKTMILENQGFHFGYRNKESENLTKMDFTALFDPPEVQWRQNILNQFEKKLPPILKNFETLTP